MLDKSSSGFLGMLLGSTVAFLVVSGEPWKFLVKPWLGVILPSGYLPVRGSGEVCTGENSELTLFFMLVVVDVWRLL